MTDEKNKKLMKVKNLVNQIDCGDSFNPDPSDEAVEAHRLLDEVVFE